MRTQWKRPPSTTSAIVKANASRSLLRFFHFVGRASAAGHLPTRREQQQRGEETVECLCGKAIEPDESEIEASITPNEAPHLLKEEPQMDSLEALHDSGSAPSDSSYWEYDESPIKIQQGCILIPIVFGVWWYWTRRTARQAVRLMIAGGDGCLRPGDPTAAYGTATSFSTDTEDAENRLRYTVRSHDEFDTWDDVVLNNNAHEDPSIHLVRWISANRRLAKRRMRTVSKAVMNRMPGKENCSPTSAETPEILSHCPSDGLLIFDDALSASTCAWECIEDVEMESITVTSAQRCLADDDSIPCNGVVV
jgi:hypothetical protein